ncbi:MAG: hypothetical protein U5L45_13475, partial [Saprospiraceae bacterium]|nr:hypothetical protein [Saprospiraceae bacterium]
GYVLLVFFSIFEYLSPKLSKLKSIIISMKKINLYLPSQWPVASTFFLTPSVLCAKHIVGGEITYKCIGGDGLP